MDDAQWAERLSGVSPLVSGDAAFMNDLAHQQRSARRSGLIVSMPAPQAHWWTGSPQDYRRAVFQLVDKLRADYEDITFVNFQLGPGGDQDFWGSSGTDSINGTIDDALEAFARARLVLAGRLHAAIAAVMSGAQVVPLAYHHKFSALLRLGVFPQEISAVLRGQERATVQSPSPVAWDTARKAARDAFRSELGRALG